MTRRPASNGRSPFQALAAAALVLLCASCATGPSTSAIAETKQRDIPLAYTGPATVADYEKAVSAAVEKKWHRNCEIHRDFITPGLISVAFSVAADGSVHDVRINHSNGDTEMTRGFTMDSVKYAGIPPMPPALAASYRSRTLPQVFNFHL